MFSTEPVGWFVSSSARRLSFSVALAAMSTVPFARAATMYSTDESYMGAGTFYGPGALDDSSLFPVIIRNMGFLGPLSYITPFVNNGPAEPNICGERQLEKVPDGLLSDGVTKVNENVDVCVLEFNGLKMAAGIVDSGPHRGVQIATTTEDGHMVMTMDFALDMQIGKGGIIRIPFYGTTGEVTLPSSLQTQMGIQGGVDKAGSLKVGDKIRGRIGDYDEDGMLDGAIVVAGTMPLDSVFLPGAPYAIVRYFDTDIPYDGAVFGKLPLASNVDSNNQEKAILKVDAPKPE